MAEANAAATTVPAFDPVKFADDLTAKFSAAIAPALKSLADNQKVLADTMAADAAAKVEATKTDKAGKKDAAADPAKAADAPKPLTADDVKKLLDDRDAAAKGNAAREAYIAEKMKNVPAIYLNKLGSDPAKFAADEQAIRDQLKADLPILGVVAKDVNGAAGTSPAAGAAPPPKPMVNGLTEGQSAYAATLKIPA